MKFRKLWLVVIVVVAVVLRFWQLGLVPPSPDWDEVALGYNAYSLLKTGADEYGDKWPLILRSFDDYKPAIYAYLLVPLVEFLGLNVWAVRLPAAVLGVAGVCLFFLLVKQMFISWRLAVLAAGLLAISPWHIQFSRIAFESNVALTFDLLWAWLFLKGLAKPFWFVLATLVAGLNLYVYQAEKVFVPLLFLSLMMIFWRCWRWVPKRYLAAMVVTGGILAFPLTKMSVTRPEIFLRAKGTSLMADQTNFLARTVGKLDVDLKSNDWLGMILDNRRIVYGLAFGEGYLSHFNFNWLFLRGDEARHHAPNMGLFYLWELPFLVVGVYQLVFGRWNREAKLLTVIWLLVAPIPAAFTTGVPHAVRSLRMLPALVILIALGLKTAWQWWLSREWRGRLIVAVMGLGVVGFNFSYYLNQYFVQQNYQNSQAWQYGYQPVIEEVEKVEAKYEQVVVSNQPHLDQSYMFFLFYLKYDPKRYQEEGGTISGGFAEAHRGFGKYTFRPIEWSREEKDKILFVGRPVDFPSGVKVLKTIYFLDGREAIKIVEG